jgi:hypothetical protein
MYAEQAGPRSLHPYNYIVPNVFKELVCTTHRSLTYTKY